MLLPAPALPPPRTTRPSPRSRPRTTCSVPVPSPATSPPISSSPPVSSVSRFSERWRASTSSTCAPSMPPARVCDPSTPRYRTPKSNATPGTMENPIPVRSAGDEQYLGCTGAPADSHVTLWLTVRRPPAAACPIPFRAPCADTSTDLPRPPHRALPRVRLRLQDGVRRPYRGRPPPRPRPPPRLRGAQDLCRLRQARVPIPINAPS
ncbi:cytochrome c oxidase subunit Vb [Colletotrichum chrysophilum]|uniref:Cytochrome c oxidase subunit Vb n=1 Tax=Colletotrichum chrysophilum TaxID=1836956 RepID=A0AAD9A6F1_9PEZI|nr:cytochrome c oxidase subunit Vb [Colletotrichum chrysophilum]